MSNINDLELAKFIELAGDVGIRVFVVHGDNWREPAVNLAALPAVSNTTGDIRETLDTGRFYRWSGSAWVDWIGVLSGGNTWTGLQTINQSGTAKAIDIIHTGNGKAISITSSMTSDYIIDIQAASLTSGRYINMQGIITTGRGINVETTGIYSGLGLGYFFVNNASSTGSGLQIRNEGTGPGLSIDQNGDGLGLVIDSEATTAKAAQIQGQQTNNDVVLIIGEGANTTATGATLRVQATNASQTAPALRVDHSGTGYLAVFTGTGNFGIGTAAPAKKFHLVVASAGGGTPDSGTMAIMEFTGTKFFHFKGDNATGQGGIAWSDNTDAFVSSIDVNMSSRYMRIYHNNAEVLRIDSTGKVGIGLTPTTELFEVAGNIRIATGGGSTPNAINIGGSGVFVGQNNGSFRLRSGFAAKKFDLLDSGSVIQFSIDLDSGKQTFLDTANKPTGAVTLVAGTATVSNTIVTANSKIFFTRKTAGGTAGGLTYTLSAGTSFTVTGLGTDTSTYDYIIFN